MIYTKRISIAARSLVILTTAACVLLSASDVPAGSKSRIVEWEGSAMALSKIVLRAGDGRVSVKAVDTDRVRIRVEVSAKPWHDEPGRKLASWFLTRNDMSDGELIESVRLRTDIDGDGLDVSLLPSGRTRKSRVNEEWTIEMPRRLALDSKFDAADVDVVGLEGGVSLRLGYGSANLDLVGGDLDVKVSVGELRVRTQGDYGNIQLRSTVGDTQMWLRGLRIEYTDPPGPGSHVSLDGEGTYKARLELEVGDAELRVD